MSESSKRPQVSSSKKALLERRWTKSPRERGSQSKPSTLVFPRKMPCSAPLPAASVDSYFGRNTSRSIRSYLQEPSLSSSPPRSQQCCAIRSRSVSSWSLRRKREPSRILRRPTWVEGAGRLRTHLRRFFDQQIALKRMTISNPDFAVEQFLGLLVGPIFGRLLFERPSYFESEEHAATYIEAAVDLFLANYLTSAGRRACSR